MQALVTEQLGALLVGTSPREYVTDIRTTIYYILNVLVTRPPGRSTTVTVPSARWNQPA